MRRRARAVSEFVWPSRADHFSDPRLRIAAFVRTDIRHRLRTINLPPARPECRELEIEASPRAFILRKSSAHRPHLPLTTEETQPIAMTRIFVRGASIVECQAVGTGDLICHLILSPRMLHLCEPPPSPAARVPRMRVPPRRGGPLLTNIPARDSGMNAPRIATAATAKHSAPTYGPAEPSNLTLIKWTVARRSFSSPQYRQHRSMTLPLLRRFALCGSVYRLRATRPDLPDTWPSPTPVRVTLAARLTRLAPPFTSCGLRRKRGTTSSGSTTSTFSFRRLLRLRSRLQHAVLPS